ncbi:MAG: aminoacetone oxidase family FAD-binding enzyme [Holophagales bacterium]|nr:aminoacetone oxidase family FAD-binding enzyme [Holophagales bacterium]
MNLAILGGGAAGLLAAIRAAEAGAAGVVVLEAAAQPGRKILVSGGGRCNVLPMEEARERFVSAAPPRVVGRYLARVPLEEQRAFFEELLGGPLREEEEGKKLFPPSNRAKDVRDALVARAALAGAEIRTGAIVREVGRMDGGFAIRMADGPDVRASRVILATGGLSVLGGGADGRGFAWAEALGHTLVPTYPALVPLTGDAPAHHALSGVSVNARVTAKCAASGESAGSEGGFLFTHKGWSGPAVLDVSHVVARAAGQTEVRVCFGFGEEEEKISSSGPVCDAWDEALRLGGRSAASLSFFLRRSSSSLSDRLIQLVLAESGVADQPLARLTRDARRRVAETLAAFPLPATGTEGYRTAEVTGGGVALDEVDPGSGKSKVVPGLWLAGEVLDAFGPIGGFNFQWAWGTGWTAGVSSARP